jgi:A/G-specific adenine glycosylase
MGKTSKQGAPPAGGMDRRAFQKALLTWYGRERREFPWRADCTANADPYRVWLSEVMLQQTTTKAVIPYYNEFTRRWPAVEALAGAPLDDVLAAWSGLGYYARARNLHACANAIVERYKGRFPAREDELLTLPGIGAYTAAAIAAIAYGAKATVVDGNVERAVARLFAIETPLPEAKPELKLLAAALTPAQRTGDYAQAMMDLGAMVCSPRTPSCLVCPVSAFCAAHAQGIAAGLPRRRPKPERPVRRGAAFVAVTDDGYVLLRQRPDKGLLALMMEVPSSRWAAGEEGTDVLSDTPVEGLWLRLPGIISHTFTHFHLELDVYRAHVPRHSQLRLTAAPERCRWVRRDEIGAQALPSIMRKVLAFALETKRLSRQGLQTPAKNFAA